MSVAISLPCTVLYLTIKKNNRKQEAARETGPVGVEKLAELSVKVILKLSQFLSNAFYLMVLFIYIHPICNAAWVPIVTFSHFEILKF